MIREDRAFRTVWEALCHIHIRLPSAHGHTAGALLLFAVIRFMSQGNFLFPQLLEPFPINLHTAGHRHRWNAVPKDMAHVVIMFGSKSYKSVKSSEIGERGVVHIYCIGTPNCNRQGKRKI